jgi:hypothetical protein
MASTTSLSSPEPATWRGISGAVSPQYTARAGMLSSKNHSSWSSPMTMVMSGLMPRNACDSSSSARWHVSACARKGSTPLARAWRDGIERLLAMT